MSCDEQRRARLDGANTVEAVIRDAVDSGNAVAPVALVGGRKYAQTDKPWSPPAHWEDDLRERVGTARFKTLHLRDFPELWSDVHNVPGMASLRRNGELQRRFDQRVKRWSDVQGNTLVLGEDGEIVFAFLKRGVPPWVLGAACCHFGRLETLAAVVEANRDAKSLKPERAKEVDCRGPHKPCQTFMVGFAPDRLDPHLVVSNAIGASEQSGANAKAVRAPLWWADAVVGCLRPQLLRLLKATDPRWLFGATCWTGCAGNICRCCLAHWDLNDKFCCIMPLGRWAPNSGRLLLWELGLRVDARQGDLVLFRSDLLLHGVEECSGRSSLVFFNKKTLDAPGLAPFPGRYSPLFARPLTEWVL